MVKKLPFLLLASLACMVGVYPIIYLLVDGRFGLLNQKSDAVLSSTVWNVNFYTHITTGGIALLIGWSQFVSKWRDRNQSLHRKIGKIYVISVLASAITAIYIAFFATGGVVPAVGFVGMGVTWFVTTFKAYNDIRRKKVTSHQRMMVYSYATCLAAVTLRIYLPIFISIFGDFNTAYGIVSWLSWVPNLIVAHLINQKYYPVDLTRSQAILTQKVR